MPSESTSADPTMAEPKAAAPEPGRELDPRTRAGLDAVLGARQEFLSAVATTADQVQGYLAAHRAPGRGDDPGRRVAVELGPFAGGRIDAGRFAALLSEDEVLDPERTRALELAESVLEDAASWGDRAFLTRVPPGEDLVEEVGETLSWLGRVFGAARVIDATRQGGQAVDRAGLLAGVAYRRWTRAERGITPPIVAEVDGRDLLAGGLAAFLDGEAKIVLVVKGEAPPAPLVRLVTPGVTVAQIDDLEALTDLVAAPGPVAVALMPEGVGARFVHDARGGKSLPERLTVESVPDEGTVKPLQGLTRSQQLQELGQLVALREAAGSLAIPIVAEAVKSMGAAGAGAGDGAPASAGSGGGAGADSGGGAADAPSSGPGKGVSLPTVDPVDKLAGWLLDQAELPEG